MFNLTPKQVERLVDEYLTNGEDDEIVGISLSPWDCPVARALVGQVDKEKFYIAVLSYAIKIRDEKTLADLDHFPTSKKVEKFIESIDYIGAKYGLSPTRKEAREIWNTL